MLGTQVTHYTIIEKLGEGGMGVVYKARDTALHRDVALKFLPSHLTSDPNEKERFYHEARAAASLTHPNIAVIHEIAEYTPHEGAGGQLFIAMEYVEGEILKKLVGSDALSTAKTLDIAIQIAEGLAAAHEKGIVHRDIKSENIILTPKGQAKIMDFGLAKMQGATKLTVAGSTLGTAAYMSPEQARGEEVDRRTDIFSFGVVLYELLAGRLPFRGDHPMALMYSIVNEDPPPVSKFNEKAPAEVGQIVRKALAKDREKRYQSVDEMLTDLRSERRRLEHPDAGYASTVRSGSRPRRRLLRIGITAAVVILLVALSLIFNPFNLKIGVEQNVAEPKPSLAVISFENLRDPSDRERTGELIMSYLTSSFLYSKDLDVVSYERLLEIQSSLMLGDSNVISRTQASQIARHANVSTMLRGMILQLRPTLTVSYDLIDVETGKLINSRRVAGFSMDALAAVADTLAFLVKDDLHVTPAAGAGSVAEVTPRSQEAYRAYLEGVRLDMTGEDAKSRVALLRSIELDSTYPMPHFLLGAGWFDTMHVREAYELRDRATERDRWLIEADYARWIEEDYGKAINILDKAQRKYPRESFVYIQPCLIYYAQLCDMDSAIEMSKRGLKNDSLMMFLWNPLYPALMNRRDEALQACNEYARLFPASGNPFDTRGWIDLASGQPDSALHYFQKAIDLGSGYTMLTMSYMRVMRGEYDAVGEYFQKIRDASDDYGKAAVDGNLSVIDLHRGELVKAGRYLDGFLERHRTAPDKTDFVVGTGGDWPVVAGGNLLYRMIIAYEERDYTKMLTLARERSEEIVSLKFFVPWDTKNPAIGRYELAWALLKNGKAGESSRIMEELAAIQKPGLNHRQRTHDYFNGVLAVERGEYDLALKEFAKWLAKLPVIYAPEYHYALALLKAGRTDEAITEFRRMTWYPQAVSPFDHITLMYNYWPIAAVKAHYWLGVAYEQQGKRDQAVKEYETFLDTWNSADFRSAEMQDARKRLAALKGSPVK